MIPHSGRVMRQCHRLSKSSMQFITGAIKNEKPCNILTSLNRQPDAESNKNQQNQQQQQQQYEQQEYIQQEYIMAYAQPNSYAQQYAHHFYSQTYTQQYMHPQQQMYPQYPQPLQYVQQPTSYLPQQYQTQQQAFYSTAVSSRHHVNIKHKATAPPPSSSTVVVKKPSATEIQDEKLRLKLERQRLSEIRSENNTRFKAYLAELPQLQYPSRYKVECVTTLDEANQRLSQLIKQDKRKVFGVDLEWPPCFVKGQRENKTSLVQICSADRILLIQLSRIQGFPSELRRFFEDKKLLKSGVNIGADGLKLQRDFGIVTNGLVELRDLAELAMSPKLGISHLRSLRALTGIFLDQNMAKGKVRMSNWARPDLTPIQIKYAALDAYASYQLYVTLDALRDVTKPMCIRHLIEEGIPVTKEEKNKKKLQYQQANHAHDNRSSPTSTVTVIKKKQQQQQQQPNKKYNDDNNNSLYCVYRL